MKVWCLAIKENRKTEPRNPHSQPQREEDSGKQMKHTEGNTFCKMFNYLLLTLGCNTEDLTFPTGMIECFEPPALSPEIRGSNKVL